MGQKLTKWFREIRDRVAVASPPVQDPPLLQELWHAVNQLRCLENQLSHADRDMVDYTIFRINAAERLCATLWQAARRENLTAWGELPNPVFKTVDC